VEALRRRVEERLALLPAYRRRLSSPRCGGLSWPRWVDHEAFDVADHVLEAALPAPGDHAQLCAWAADFWSRRLDRTLPLWEIALVTGLADGRWALVTKTHHAMVDGVGSIDAGILVFDLPDGMDPPEPVIDAPDDQNSIVGRALGLVRAGAGVARHPRDLLARSRAALELIVRDEVVAAPHTSLNDPIGSRRRFATVSVDLDEAKAIKHALGGTVNDVALTAVAGGLRRLLEHRGEVPPPQGLRAMVPVNVREPGVQLGNHITSLFVHLPVAAADTAERWRLTVAEAQALKSGTQGIGSRAVVDLAALAPPVLHTLLAQSLFASRLFNVTVTNVPGPPDTLWSFGSPMIDVLPLVPLAAAHAVGVAIVSYDGRLTFGVIGDHETVPDLGAVTRGIEDTLAELRDLAHVPAHAG
jgi:WS/DGAT/MGAT family acyltransferase